MKTQQQHETKEEKKKWKKESLKIVCYIFPLTGHFNLSRLLFERNRLSDTVFVSNEKSFSSLPGEVVTLEEEGEEEENKRVH